MRDYFSNDVETAAMLAREDPFTPYLDDDRPTRAELEEDREADRRFDQRREGDGR